MAKEYELTAFDTGKTPHIDGYGNTWATAVFLGEGEPVKWVVKDPATIKVGQKYYGTITEETSKAGKTYLRFRREKVPEAPQGVSNDKPTEEYWENKQAQIKAQWAINQSREYIQHKLGDGSSLEEILDTAKLFYGMVDQVVNSEQIDWKDRDIVNLEDLPL